MRKLLKNKSIIAAIICVLFVALAASGAAIGVLFLAPVVLILAIGYFVLRIILEFTNPKHTKQYKIDMLKRLLIVLVPVAIIFIAVNV